MRRHLRKVLYCCSVVSLAVGREVGPKRRGALDMFLARFGEKWAVFIGGMGLEVDWPLGSQEGPGHLRDLICGPWMKGGNARLVGWTHREVGRGDGGA